LNISNVGTSSASYLTYAEFETARTLTVTANANNLSVGSNLALTATLSNGTTGIPGAAVTAQINRADNITDTVTLAHQGNGVYTANYLVPNAPGYLPVSVTATGSDGGTAFERQESLMLAIAPQTAQLTGSYSDSAVDDDGDGLFDNLNIQVGVNPSVSSDFTLSGDLVVGSQIVAHAGAYVSLTTGAQNVTLSFSGDDIRATNLNGPYTLTNLTLSDMTYGSIPVVSATNVYTTAAYTAADFAATCYTLNLAANPPFGGTLTPDIAPNCNGGTQYTSGGVVTLTSTANAGYKFSGWSGDTGGAANPITLTIDEDKTAIADFSVSLSAPSLLSLPENALTTNYAPILDWSDSTPVPDHYEIQIATDNALNGLVIDETTADSTYTPVVALNPNSKYYWRVRAFNAAGQFGPWSATRSFRTAILSPVSAFPGGLQQPAGLRPLFDWGNVSSASSYNLQISTNQNFATLVLNLNLTPSAYVPMADLPKGATLFWRVRANGANGPSAWSRVRHFDSPNPPSVPTLLTPAHNATAANGQPTLDWSDSSPGVDHYEVQISTSPTFATVLGRGQGGRTGASQYMPEAALGMGAYYWRVRAVNAQGQFSQWSAARSFNVP
jgi:predicted phage tail protein